MATTPPGNGAPANQRRVKPPGGRARPAGWGKPRQHAPADDRPGACGDRKPYRGRRPATTNANPETEHGDGTNRSKPYAWKPCAVGRPPSATTPWPPRHKRANPGPKCRPCDQPGVHRYASRPEPQPVYAGTAGAANAAYRATPRARNTARRDRVTNNSTAQPRKDPNAWNKPCRQGRPPSATTPRHK